MNRKHFPIKLKGMTWGHPRGFDPLIVCSAYRAIDTGVEIEWDKRSLQDFESFPVQELAHKYDLIVIDHPHVGQITAENCLLPFEGNERATEYEAIRRGSVGLSFESYSWESKQWALPIDAASQVQAYRADRIGAAPKQWKEVVDMARHGLVLFPMRPPHSLMCLYTLSANMGSPCNTEKGNLIEKDAGTMAYEAIAEIVGYVEHKCFEMDPISVLEIMAKVEGEIACFPLIYGYVNYATQGFRERRISFTDIPCIQGTAPVGSALGGTGIAVSLRSQYPKEAVDFAYWLASGNIQSSYYAASGGQPGHAEAWESAMVNCPVMDFYRNTRATLEGAWLRPRHNGYMNFQNWAAERLNIGLLRHESPQNVITDMNDAYERSFVGAN